MSTTIHMLTLGIEHLMTGAQFTVDRQDASRLTLVVVSMRTVWRKAAVADFRRAA